MVQNPKISAIEVLGKALSQPIVTIEFSEEPLPAFIRGDATGNGRLTIGDPVMVLRHIFGPQDLTCEDAADADDDGKLDLADPILVLHFLFRGGVSIPPPAKTCAADLTTDEISCVSHYFCGEQ